MTNKAKTVKSQGKNPNQSIKPAYGLGFTSANLQAQFAVNDADFQKHKYEKLARLAWFSENEEPQKVSQKVIEAIRLYESLAPEDGVEAILCEQMVGNSLAINELLRRASNSKNYDTAVKCCKTASQLQGQFLKQAAFLDKHRGRNPQKVVVEHVNVESGGQAIVGHVETKGPKS
jgi:hypothetical protein